MDLSGWKKAVDMVAEQNISTIYLFGGDVLLKKVVVDPSFSVFQSYLDNILAPSSRLVTNDMNTFSQGLQKIKEFRDNLEKELP